MKGKGVNLSVAQHETLLKTKKMLLEKGMLTLSVSLGESGTNYPIDVLTPRGITLGAVVSIACRKLMEDIEKEDLG